MSCIHVCFWLVCVQESQISRQRRTVVPSVPQNAEREARSLFAKEVRHPSSVWLSPRSVSDGMPVAIVSIPFQKNKGGLCSEINVKLLFKADIKSSQ